MITVIRSQHLQFAIKLAMNLAVVWVVWLLSIDARASDFVLKDDTSLFSKPNFYNPLSACSCHCSASFYSGRYVTTSMDDIFGRRAVTPIWQWNWDNSSLVAATVSRKFIENPGWWSIDGELGAAKRFGEQHATENWVALYFRWSAFPWNHIIRTSIATSTGLSYAWSLDALEIERANNGHRGSQLLHFLSPEVTFGHPKHPEWDVFFRFHHRSGAFEILPSISSTLFNGANGGSQYFTVGFRYNF